MISRLIIAAALMSFGASAAYADWTKAQQDEFLKTCTSDCQTDPKVSAAQRDKCQAYCECNKTGMEKLFPDLEKGNRSTSNGGSNANAVQELKSKFDEVMPACNKRAFDE